MSNPIKSADLCERCFYSLTRCLSSSIACTTACGMYDGGRCKCLDIKPNTPCPYFEEEDDNGKASD